MTQIQMATFDSEKAATATIETKHPIFLGLRSVVKINLFGGYRLFLGKEAAKKKHLMSRPRNLRSDITIFSALGFMGMACAKLLIAPRPLSWLNEDMLHGRDVCLPMSFACAFRNQWHAFQVWYEDSPSWPSSWIFITFSYLNILAILAIVSSFILFLCNGSTLKQKQRELLAEKNRQARQEEVYLSSLDLSRINESKDLQKKRGSRWNGKVPMVSCPQNTYRFFADFYFTVVEG